MLMDKKIFLYAPDDAGGGSPPATPPAEPAGSAALASATPPPSAPSTPPTGDASGGGTPAASGAGASAPSWLDSLRKDGIDAPDETSAIARIRQLKQERDQLDSIRSYIPHINEYLTNSKEFQAFRQERQKQQAAPSQVKKDVWSDYWQPPEYNPSWERHLITNPDGTRGWAKDTPPEVIAKAQAYANFRTEQAEKLISNPHAFIEPTVIAHATRIANEIIEQRLGKQQGFSQAQSFISQNQGWIFDIDPQTKQPKTANVFDPQTGGYRSVPVMTPLGKKFQEYATQEHERQVKRGYTDDQEVTDIAMAKIQRDFAVSEMERLQQGAQPPATPGAPAKTPQQAANDKFLDKANPAGRGAARPAAANGNATPIEPKVTKRNLEKQLLADLRGAGFNNDNMK